VVQVGPGVEIEEFLDLVGVMGGQVVDDAVQVVTKLSEQVEPVTQPATVPSCTLNPANRTAVPLRSYSSSLRSFLPGAARTVGLTRALAWIEVFSSTDHTTALVGGPRYRPHTSAAFSQKSGSWLVIHDCTGHRFRSSPRQMRQIGDAEMGTP
jgi:hypothetical protein